MVRRGTLGESDRLEPSLVWLESRYSLQLHRGTDRLANCLQCAVVVVLE